MRYEDLDNCIVADEDCIDIEFVRQYMQQTDFNLVPTQEKLSFPMLKRYYLLLRNGHLPKAIHVAESAIVDGHHRYISGHLFGKCPEKVPSIRPKANRIRVWANVVIDEEDYGEK